MKLSEVTNSQPRMKLSEVTAMAEQSAPEQPAPSFYDRLRAGLSQGANNLGSMAAGVFTDPMAGARNTGAMIGAIGQQPSTTAFPAQMGASAADATAALIDMPANAINAGLRLKGSEAQIPTVTQYFSDIGLTSDSMPAGLGREVANFMGQAGLMAGSAIPVAGRNVATVPGAVAEFAGFGSAAPVNQAAGIAQDVAGFSGRPPVVTEGAAPGKTEPEILNALVRGEPNANTAGYRIEMVNGIPQLAKDEAATAVLKTGVEPSIVALIDKSDPLTIANMEKMVNVTDNMLIDESVKGRALDVVGNSIMKRYKTLDTANKIAGKMVNEEGKKLTGQVDLGYTINNFQKGLADSGVQVTDDGLDFSASVFSKLPTTQKVLTEIYNDLLTSPKMDAKKAHFFKRAVTKSAQFGANVEGVDADAVRLIRGVRAGVNEAIGKISPSYANANKHYADTVTALEQLTDAAGTKVDFDSPTADRAAGTVVSRILTNYGSGPNVERALDAVTDLSRKYASGVEGFNSDLLRKAAKVAPEDLADDLYNQVKFALYLERKIGTNAKRSMTGIQQGTATKAAEDLAFGGLGPANVGRTALNYYREATGKGYKDQLQSMRDLLRQRRGGK